MCDIWDTIRLQIFYVFLSAHVSAGLELRFGNRGNGSHQDTDRHTANTDDPAALVVVGEPEL